MSLEAFEHIKKADDKNYEIFVEPKIKASLTKLNYNLLCVYEDSYPAKFHPDFCRDMILFFSNKGDLVWDGCCGSGISIREANKLGRFGIGTDVNPIAIDISKQHSENYNLDKYSKYYLGDARKIKLDKQPDLILSSLPFGINIEGDKNSYSNESDDLSTCKTYEDFIDESRNIIQNYYENLRPGGICVLDARDRSKDGKYYDLINYFRSHAYSVGFELLARGYYELIPYQKWSSKDPDNGFVKPMPGTMDFVILKKPIQRKLI